MLWRICPIALLALLVLGAFTSSFPIQPVKANGTIYIRADGSIDPPSAPISTVDKVTYTLTGNITSYSAVAQSFSFVDTGQRLGQIINGVASIATGDVNNDGYVDVVVASHERGTIVQLYLNDGKGNFVRTDDIFRVTDNPNPLWNFGIVLSDFDRDGLLDIATADAWRGVNIYLNSRNGGFNWSQAILVPAVNEVKGIDAADVDGDGDNDIVFGGHNGIPDRADSVYLNEGNGHFTDSSQRIGSDVTWDTIFGDLNNDGYVDYVSVNRYRENTAKIHVNNGAGLFDKTVDIPTTQTDDSYDVKVADLNTDGLLDIVVANSLDPENGATSKIFLNRGNFSFELADSILGPPNCETKGVKIVDIDNDGFCDIVLGNYNYANMIYHNNGTGGFTRMNIELPTNQTTSIEAADFNNDGFIDLIIGNALDGYYRVYLNDGNGLTCTHDVAVTGVVSLKTVVGQNYCRNLTVTVQNQGNFAEDFNVTVYANSTIINNLEFYLICGSTSTQGLLWNSSGFGYGNYSINAVADAVLNETDVADNNFTGGWVIVAGVGDLTGGTPNLLDFVPDGTVNMKDVGVVARFFLQTIPPASANCDLTGPTQGVPDGVINMRDVGTVAKHFGEHYP